MNPHHKEILSQIKKHSGKPTQHTFLDAYLGNENPRYPINTPTLRTIAKHWMQEHPDLSAPQFATLLSSLNTGASSTEKITAGILMDYAKPDQRKFRPAYFDKWLNNLTGWAEVDTVCTGKYSTFEIPAQWETWKPLLLRFSKSKNIQKRRASLVFFCSPLRQNDNNELAVAALENVDRLKSEKDILITKAISWVLRSMYRHHRKLLAAYMKENMDLLPKIAVRETITKLKSGTKNAKKMS